MAGDTKKTNIGSQRYLAFSLKDEEFAVPLSAVREVIAMPDITPVPHAPNHFLGIMNLRGQVISIMDLRTKLGMKAQGDNPTETGVIIFDFGDVSLGSVVSSINSVVSFSSEEIQDKPQTLNQFKSDYITGVAKRGDKLTLILDVARALDQNDLTQLVNNKTKAA